MKKIIFVNAVFSAVIILNLGCQQLKPKPVGANYFQQLWDSSLVSLKAQEVDEAENTLKELYSLALNADPELSTKALFELGQINERKGLWLQALSQFKECELKKSQLPGFKAELELPARLAGLYATLGELQISKIYAKKVEANIQTYMQQVSLSQQKSWWAETFFHVGSFPIQYMNAENWDEFAERFHSTSQYLVRSMELSDEIWSNRSLELAQAFFKKSFEVISIPTNEIEENRVILGGKIRDRISMLDEILQKIQIYSPTDFKNARIAWLFYQSIEDYQKQIRSKLYQVKDSAPLSKQSEERNAIKRTGDLKSIPSGSVDKTKKDPNL